jgi:Holliday junction DNA helicase RuvA
MIYSIKGNLVYKDYEKAGLEINGIVFEINIPMRTFLSLPDLNNPVKLFTLLMTNSDNDLVLYGFETYEEKNLFSRLIKVMGVGPKTALTLFSKMKYQEIITAIDNKDSTALSSVPGIGKKTAGRIILELSGKLAKPEEQVENEYFSDVVEALISLGYKKNDASKIVGEVLSDSTEKEQTIENILKESLKRFTEK